MTYNSEIHHRRSIRLRDFNYSTAGAYFVTICAWNRECLFGEIVDGAALLNCFGDVVHEEWLRSEVVREIVSLDAFVIMPNHFHGIILLSDGICLTTGNPLKKGDPPGRPYDDNRDVGRSKTLPRRVVSGSIGAIVGQFKSIVTKQINVLRENQGCPVWQRNYYERVIRNENELARAREYIMNNPLRWDADENNPANS